MRSMVVGHVAVLLTSKARDILRVPLHHPTDGPPPPDKLREDFER
jgi:hypothetical protein